jgi:superoxide dismutase, Cu-Zn family
MPIKNVRFATVLAAGALALTCGIPEAQAQAMKGPTGGPEAARAVAVLLPTKGSKVEGTVTFTRGEKGIRVQADVSGLAPGKHGFHIHEFGDSSSPDGMAAGGHFNPHKMEHGAPTAEKRHVGDLGNLEADSAGHATLDLVDPALSFSGSSSILGRGVVVHEKPDDFGQPTGNAGGRVAVGVIGVAKDAK